MTVQKRALILKLVRFQNASDAIQEAMIDQYDRDSAFDAGEFSGPAIVADADRKREAVARRLGFSNVEVIDLVIDHLDVVVRRPAICYGYPAPLPR